MGGLNFLWGVMIGLAHIGLVSLLCKLRGSLRMLRNGLLPEPFLWATTLTQYAGTHGGRASRQLCELPGRGCGPSPRRSPRSSGRHSVNPPVQVPIEEYGDALGRAQVPPGVSI
jgi:hypothetical protein